MCGVSLLLPFLYLSKGFAGASMPVAVEVTSIPVNTQTICNCAAFLVIVVSITFV